MKTRQHAAVTLIEVLIVISLMTIIAAAVLPSANPSLREQLYSAAEVVAADVAFARSLAITNNSKYRLLLRPATHEIVLEHSGSAAALDALPRSALRETDNTATQHVLNLAELPHLAVSVDLHAAQALASSLENVTEVEFSELGSTTRAEDTALWLATGRGNERRYLCVRINAATGLTWIENYRATAPPAAALSLNPLNNQSITP